MTMMTINYKLNVMCYN